MLDAMFVVSGYTRLLANANRKYACNVVGAAACGRLWYAAITAINNRYASELFLRSYVMAVMN